MRINLFKSILICFAFLSILSICYRVYVFGNLSSMGTSIRDYEVEIAKLQKENSLLKEQIASVSSLSSIKELALKDGMVEPVKTDYLVTLSASNVNSFGF